MTDETKKVFDAPWYVFSAPDDEITVIENESGRVLAELDDVKTANRIDRLPELYDALQEAIFEINRLIDALENGTDFGDFCDKYLKEYGNVPSGFTCEWAQLLTKVSKGE